MTEHSNLTQGSIRSHLIKLAIPASMGMMSDTALVGLSIASIVFILLIALTIGLQSGTSAMVAPDFANKNTTEVKTWIANSIGNGLVMGIKGLALATVII